MSRPEKFSFKKFIETVAVGCGPILLEPQILQFSFFKSWQEK
jgi:hypothetical protein